MSVPYFTQPEETQNSRLNSGYDLFWNRDSKEELLKYKNIAATPQRLSVMFNSLTPITEYTRYVLREQILAQNFPHFGNETAINRSKSVRPISSLETWEWKVTSLPTRTMLNGDLTGRSYRCYAWNLWRVSAKGKEPVPTHGRQGRAANSPNVACLPHVTWPPARLPVGMKTYGDGGIAPHTLNFGIRWFKRSALAPATLLPK
jgi:hypothetical protein